MEFLITANDTIGPVFRWVGFGLWVTVVLGSFVVWKRANHNDLMVSGAYITALFLFGWFQSIFENQVALAVCHILTIAFLVTGSFALNALQTKYGDFIKVMGAFMVVIDVTFYVTDMWIQAQLWLINLLFVAICLAKLYSLKYTRKNSGNLGSPKHVATIYYKSYKNAGQSS